MHTLAAFHRLHNFTNLSKDFSKTKSIVNVLLTEACFQKSLNFVITLERPNEKYRISAIFQKQVQYSHNRTTEQKYQQKKKHQKEE